MISSWVEIYSSYLHHYLMKRIIFGKCASWSVPEARKWNFPHLKLSRVSTLSLWTEWTNAASLSKKRNGCEPSVSCVSTGHWSSTNVTIDRHTSCHSERHTEIQHKTSHLCGIYNKCANMTSTPQWKTPRPTLTHANPQRWKITNDISKTAMKWRVNEVHMKLHL